MATRDRSHLWHGRNGRTAGNDDWFEADEAWLEDRTVESVTSPDVFEPLVDVIREPRDRAAEAEELNRSKLAERRERDRRVRRSRQTAKVAVGLVGVAILLVAVLVGGRALFAPDLEASGPAQGARIGPKGLEKLQFGVTGKPKAIAGATWTLDGTDVTAKAKVSDGSATFSPGKLTQGDHTVAVKANGSFPLASTTHEWVFTVDTTPPKLLPSSPSVQVARGQGATIIGTVEPGSKVVAGKLAAKVVGDRFTLKAPIAAGALDIVATDAAGNTSTTAVTIEIVARRPPAPVRGVHVSAAGWASDEIRGGVLSLVDRGLINTIELDLKNEDGVVGWDSRVPLAQKIGAVQQSFDLDEAVQLLHARGVRVVGRLVAFRDPIMATAMWKQKRRARVIQTVDGDFYDPQGYGGFTNFANAAVQQYNIDIARDAADRGVDEILYDYVRRPDGPIDGMQITGLRGDRESAAEDAITKFMCLSRKQLPEGVYLGASVFGIAASRPHEIAQNVPEMARCLDYVAPMVYPSHWGRDEYGVSSPVDEPYAIVNRSLADFQEVVEGTGARVVPWLQDFTLGRQYTCDDVRQQISGAADAGAPEWLLWDPENTYCDDLDPAPRAPASSGTG